MYAAALLMLSGCADYVEGKHVHTCGHHPRQMGKYGQASTPATTTAVALSTPIST